MIDPKTLAWATVNLVAAIMIWRHARPRNGGRR